MLPLKLRKTGERLEILRLCTLATMSLQISVAIEIHTIGETAKYRDGVHWQLIDHVAIVDVEVEVTSED